MCLYNIGKKCLVPLTFAKKKLQKKTFLKITTSHVHKKKTKYFAHVLNCLLNFIKHQQQACNVGESFCEIEVNCFLIQYQVGVFV